MFHALWDSWDSDSISNASARRTSSPSLKPQKQDIDLANRLACGNPLVLDDPVSALDHPTFNIWVVDASPFNDWPYVFAKVATTDALGGVAGIGVKIIQAGWHQVVSIASKGEEGLHLTAVPVNASASLLDRERRPSSYRNGSVDPQIDPITLRIHFVLIQDQPVNSRGDFRNILLSLMASNIPSLNCIRAFHMASERTFTYSILKSIEHRVGSLTFPVANADFYTVMDLQRVNNLHVPTRPTQSAVVSKQYLQDGQVLLLRSRRSEAGTRLLEDIRDPRSLDRTFAAPVSLLSSIQSWLRIVRISTPDPNAPVYRVHARTYDPSNPESNSTFTEIPIGDRYRKIADLIASHPAWGRPLGAHGGDELTGLTDPSRPHPNLDVVAIDLVVTKFGTETIVDAHLEGSAVSIRETRGYDISILATCVLERLGRIYEPSIAVLRSGRRVVPAVSYVDLALRYVHVHDSDATSSVGRLSATLNRRVTRKSMPPLGRPSLPPVVQSPQPQEEIEQRRDAQSYTVTSPYEPQKPGEIALSTGDQATPHVVFADGICHGVNHTTGATGTFPTNRLEGYNAAGTPATPNAPITTFEVKSQPTTPRHSHSLLARSSEQASVSDSEASTSGPEDESVDKHHDENGTAEESEVVLPPKFVPPPMPVRRQLTKQQKAKLAWEVVKREIEIRKEETREAADGGGLNLWSEIAAQYARPDGLKRSGSEVGSP
ncbi:hypothetical protein BJ742DRAFT_908777 [Cladochytrium replicatum]|nr:hypothetical protein BJ742DRAFT_908777 [Cladochytrium replicatum]